ncbi:MULTISPECIES: hypothetical protein [unclassified Streptomyces]|uniref:hypothetical protein n=1 Tax=unclassified Streptomyces TaxID=2593676 RepID=UPI0037031812
MISEPELEGGAPFEVTEVLTEEREPRPRRARPPWLWALVGALAASVVWGGGLYAYGLREEPGPDLGGYKPVEALCERAELKALGAVLGARSENSTGPFMDTPAVSESSCSAMFGPVESGQGVGLTYTLHKVIDPEPEFAARAEQYGLLNAVEGVGRKAFFDDRGEDGGSMWILDGRMELRIELYREQNFDDRGEPIGSGPPRDLSGIDVPMAQDALALMAALKK